MIVEAGWDLVVWWTKADAAKAPKAKMAAEQKQIALGDDVADILAKRGEKMGRLRHRMHGTHVKPGKRDVL